MRNENVTIKEFDDALVEKFASQGDDFWDPMTVQTSNGAVYDVSIDYEPDNDMMGLYADVKGQDGYEESFCADMDISDCEETEDLTEFAERYFTPKNDDFVHAVWQLADYIHDAIENEDPIDEDL